MNRILYVSYDGMTDPLGQSQVLPYLAGLADLGYRITVLSCEKRENYIKQREVITAFTHGKKIRWEHIFYTKKPAVLSTLWDLYRLNKKAFRLHEKHDFDIVHCRSYIPSLIGLSLKRKKNIKFIFDMRGFWADERIEGNLWDQKLFYYRLIYKFFKIKETEFINNADYVVVLTEAARKIIQGWQNVNKDKLKIKIIPCCVDTNLFNPDVVTQNQKNKLLKELNLTTDDLIISYVGSVGTWYLLGEMMRFFKLIKQHFPSAKFLLITNAEEKTILSEVERNGISPDAIRAVSANRAHVPLYISLSVASVFFINSTFSKKGSSPTKLAEILSMGIPVIANKGIGDMDSFFKDKKIGVLVSLFNKESYTHAVKYLKEISNIDCRVIRDFAIENFSVNNGIKLYKGIYEEIANV